jgi:hypothetical protein
MPGYIPKVLARFKDWLGTHAAASPGVYKAPAYGVKVQQPVRDEALPLSAADKTALQRIVGSILYYARAVDLTMLTNCNTISSDQAKPTDAVEAPAVRLLIKQFAIGLANDAIKQKKSKSIDLRFHWIRDRIRQGRFTMLHIPGNSILADFFTKTLSAADHQAMMPRLMRVPVSSHTLGGWQRATKRRKC